MRRYEIYERRFSLVPPVRSFLLTNDVLTVRCASSQLPPSLVTVTLCENQLAELRDVSQLAQLTVSANPCHRRSWWSISLKHVL